MSLRIENEQEAIAAILYASASINGEISDFESDKAANMLVYSKKFKGANLKEILAKVFYLKSTIGCVDLIVIALPFIEENFKKTMYAMVCDLLCSDGETSEIDLRLMGMIADKFEMEQAEYMPIASTFMARYLWNVQVPV